MLKLIIKPQELWDEVLERFVIAAPGFELELEHSLASVSKWESKHQIPFLSGGKKSPDQVLDYIRMMILTPEFPPEVFAGFSAENFDQVQAYIESKESATTFGELPERKGRSEVITSELIYYWMVTFNIPFVCESWHLNRLFSLIKICNLKHPSAKPKKMSAAALNRRNTEINRQRREALNSKG